MAPVYQKNVKYTLASHAVERLRPSDDAINLMQKMSDGKISADDAVNQLLKKYGVSQGSAMAESFSSKGAFHLPIDIVEISAQNTLDLPLRDQPYNWNFAIDSAYQNWHYGQRALRDLLLMLKQEYHAKVVTTTYTFGNGHAKHVYEKVGFRETDVVDENGIHEVNMAVEL